MSAFWDGFEKRAVSNEAAASALINNMFHVASKNPAERAALEYLKKSNPNFKSLIKKWIRRHGEAPQLNWTHNVKPADIKNRIHDVGKHKSEPGWVSQELKKYINEVK